MKINNENNNKIFERRHKINILSGKNNGAIMLRVYNEANEEDLVQVSADWDTDGAREFANVGGTLEEYIDWIYTSAFDSPEGRLMNANNDEKNEFIIAIRTQINIYLSHIF